MKKKPSDGYYDKYLYSRRLYREDIEYIIQHIQERNYPLTISDDQFEYETLEEVLSNRGFSPENLHIEVKYEGDSIRLFFSKRRINIHIWGVGDLRAVGFEIIDYLETRPKIVPEMIDPSKWLGVSFGLIIFSVLWDGIDKGGVPDEIGYFFVGTLLLSVITGLYKWTVPGLSLQRSHENFWRRNKDRVFLLIIGATLGALATYLAGLFSG